MRGKVITCRRCQKRKRQKIGTRNGVTRAWWGKICAPCFAADCRASNNKRALLPKTIRRRELRAQGKFECACGKVKKLKERGGRNRNDCVECYPPRKRRKQTRAVIIANLRSSIVHLCARGHSASGGKTAEIIGYPPAELVAWVRGEAKRLGLSKYQIRHKNPVARDGDIYAALRAAWQRENLRLERQ